MPARQKNHLSPTRSQRGAVLMLLLLLFAVGALAVFVTGLNRATVQLDRDRITSEALAQAKEALIGDAAAVSEVTDAGHLQLPDLGFGPIHPTVLSEGYAAPNFAGNFKDYSVIGKIPWRSLGIAPLQDGQGECLWYVVSGRFKKTPPTGDVFNWDTPGQIDVIDGNGSPIANNIAALVVSPGRGVDQQERKQSDPAYTQCGGNYDARNYLDSYNVSDAVSGVVNYFSGSTNSRVAPDANNKQFVMAANNHYNDRFLFITVDDIFRPIIRRSDFATQIQDLLNDTYFWTTNITLTGDKGTDDILCSSLSPSNRPFCINWKEMLLLTNLPSPSPITIDGSPTSEVCDRVLIFGGQKKATQVRLTADDKDKPVNYLEAPNLDAFAAHDGSFSGASGFKSTNPSADILRCIKLAGSVQTSFAADFGKFVATGTLVSDDDGVQVYGTGVTVNTINKTLAIGGAGGTAGGCFWYPDAIPLAKTLRAYYEYQFSYADTYALTGTGSDRGNGFTFQMVRNDQGNPKAVCGLVANMGALALGDPASDIWGSGSFIIETDVHEDAARSDPAANHTAIMYGGNLDHSLTNGNPTADCNGTAAGCLYNPANKFEEFPSPVSHSQRIQVHAGCNSSCSSCVATNAAAPKIKMMTWVDCADCDDVAVNLLDPELIKAVQNRDFSAPGSWTGTNWQVTGDVLSHSVSGADAVSLPNTALYSAPVAGVSYQVTVTVATTLPGKLVIAFGGASSAAIDLVAGAPKAYTVKLTAVSSDVLKVKPDAAWVGSLDNVSIVAIKPDMNAELISASQDRDFSAPGSWTGTNWQVSNGVLAHSLAGANAVSLPNSALISPPVAGRIYQVTVSVATSTPGKLAIAFGGATPMSIDLVAGPLKTFSFLFVSATTEPLSLSPDNAWVGEIDNVSITPIRTDTSAAELIKSTLDRDFSAPGNWSGANWQVEGGVLSHPMAGANVVLLSNTWLSGAAIPGNLYQVTFTASTIAAGKLAVRFGGTTAAAIDLVAEKTATYEVLLLAASTGALRLSPDAAWTGSVDNVSVKRLRSPTIQRCLDADTNMNPVYFGFTGGFLSGVNTRQGVTFKNFYLRSE
jgi:hypothetical protein